MTKILLNLLMMQGNLLQCLEFLSYKVHPTFICQPYHLHHLDQKCPGNMWTSSQTSSLSKLGGRQIGLSHWGYLKDTLALSHPLHSPLMGSKLPQAPGTRQSEYGMLRLAKLCLGHLKGTLTMSHLLHSPLMGSKLPQAPGTRQSESGMLRLAKLCLGHLKGTLPMSHLLHSRLMVSRLTQALET